MFRTSVCVCVCFLLACCVLPMAAQQGQPQVTTYYACINNSTGAIRIVGKTTVCKSTEHKINWNQVGPQGPKGPQGAQGPQGPQGPPGISVGYSAILPPGSNVVLTAPTVVAQTNPIATSGLYYISGSALLSIGALDVGGFCYDALASDGNPREYSGGNFVGGYEQASFTDALSINAGDSVEMVCYALNEDGSSYVYNAGLTATLINSGSDVNRQHAKKVPPPSKH